MENLTFKAGDIVTLKSGGPDMTVEKIGNYTYELKVLCTWFEGVKKNTELFYPESLKLKE